MYIVLIQEYYGKKGYGLRERIRRSFLTPAEALDYAEEVVSLYPEHLNIKSQVIDEATGEIVEDWEHLPERGEAARQRTERMREQAERRWDKIGGYRP